MRFKNNVKEKVKKIAESKQLSYYIDTMGCALNENDSSKYAGILESMGFVKSQTEEQANLVLFNTCSIRENAENTLLGRLGKLKHRRLTVADTYLVVVGCMSQQQHIIDKIKKSYSYTDIVLGTHSMQSFPDKLYHVLVNKEKVYEFCEQDIVLEDVPVKLEDKYKASVSIIYGCNNFCTYCIVPYVRGRERSRLQVDIVKDVQKLADRGYREIMLLGQNVNTYGRDLKDGTTFTALLREIEKIQGIEVIKFLSPHPKDFTDDLIDLIATSNKIAKQIHLPLQSGSSRILKLMNRSYTKQQFLALAEKMKKKSSQITFSTDIIVGFPGETEQDFQETLEVVNTIQFDQIYMFIYSKRTGTKAAQMDDTTPYKEKVDRLKRLKALFQEITSSSNEKMLNKEYTILIEGKSKTNEAYYTGRTNTNKIVIFKADEKDVGMLKKVKITGNHLWYLKGEIQ